VRTVLTELCADPTTITYRQAVLADLIDQPGFATALEALLPDLGGLALAGTSRWADEGGIFQVAGRLVELEGYVTAVTALLATLNTAAPGLRATGWLNLHQQLRTLASSAEFQTLAAELPTLRSQLERASSVTLGINLDAQLRPESATLLSVNTHRFGGPRSLLGRLLTSERERQSGLSPLRQAGERQTFGPDRQLFLDLSQLLEDVTAPVATALARFARIAGGSLGGLENEIAFYLGAARFVQRARIAGWSLCRPTLALPSERLFRVNGLYNLELALRLHSTTASAGLPVQAVPNDVIFDDTGRIFILTGPNRGGKTTFTRAVGLAHVLAQAGLLVPGTAATISPVDTMFTLFPAAERAETGMGRLDEEAAKLAEIFRRATAHSLVLLNEPLGSTSPGEALTIARDVVGGLRMLGARAIIVTHLYELAHAASALNRTVAGASRVASLVAGVADVAGNGAAQATRSYRVTRAEPSDQSHAADIALAHGLHLRQIEQTLHERGVVQGDE
jgi:hypothetical protein